MKIYFTASILQSKDFGAYYKRIVEALKKAGHTVQADHILKNDLSGIKTQSDNELKEYYKRAVKWITDAEVVVVEASFPSTLNIGHEISLSLEKGKPVLILYKEGFSSLFLSGSDSERLLFVEYTETDLEEALISGIDFAKDQADTRFNFFISPGHATYLDWIAQHRRIPRSVYLRQLIKRDMEQSKDYK